MKPKVGLYFFCKKRGYFAIYQYDVVNEQTGYKSASHIDDTYSYEDAVSKVYTLNDWHKPKNIKRVF